MGRDLKGERDLPRPPSPRPGQPLARQLLGLFAVFSLGPLFVSNFWGYVETRSRLSDAAFRDVQNVASIEATEARRSVNDKRELLASVVAGNQHLFSMMRSLSTCAAAELCGPVRSALEALLQAKVAEGAVLGLIAMSADQRVLGTSATTSEPSAAGTRPEPPPSRDDEPHSHAHGHAHQYDRGEPAARHDGPRDVSRI